MNRRSRYAEGVTKRRRLWLAIIVMVSIGAFAVVIPMAPSLGPDTREIPAAERFTMTFASVTVPAGWDMDIAAAVDNQAVLSKGGVRIGVSDAIWLGESDTLVRNVSHYLFDGKAQLPDVPQESLGEKRETWTITPTDDAADGAPLRVIVVRQDQSVVLVQVKGTPDAVAEAQQTIDEIVASSAFEAPGLDVESGQ